MPETTKKAGVAEFLAALATQKITLAGLDYEVRDVVLEQDDKIFELLDAAGLEDLTEKEVLGEDVGVLMRRVDRARIIPEIAAFALSPVGGEWSVERSMDILAKFKSERVKKAEVTALALGFFIVNAGYIPNWPKTFQGLLLTVAATMTAEKRESLGIPSWQTLVGRANLTEHIEPSPSGRSSIGNGPTPSDPSEGLESSN